MLLLGILLGMTAVCVAAIYDAYYQLPLPELKRRSRRGDDLATALYRAASYGLSIKALLIVLGLTSLYFSLFFTERATSNWIASLVTLGFVALCALALIPQSKMAQPVLRLAASLAPLLVWLTERLHPVLDRLGRTVRRLRPVRVHTGVYTREDLLQLMEIARKQSGSGFLPGELDIVSHALAFGDKLVRDVMTPKRVVRCVRAGDVVGPVLMGELHETGHSRFPVYEGNGEAEKVIGVLFVHDMVQRMDSRPVRELMHPRVRYVHEDYTLYQTLQAFLKTKQHLFVVVNEFEEYVGIITIEDVLEQVIGKPIIDEFDQYDDLRAVAASAARRDHATHQE